MLHVVLRVQLELLEMLVLLQEPANVAPEGRAACGARDVLELLQLLVLLVLLLQ